MSSLDRFIAPQSAVYDEVVAELKKGRKETHWIWFVFPQLVGLGVSNTSQRFGFSGKSEAQSYLEHPILGSRLLECTRLVNEIEGRAIEDIFDFPDNLKFRSSMTLFAQATGDNQVFVKALDKYFNGNPDPATLQILREH